MNMLIPVILSGRAGTRLYPVSRERHPKPFITLVDGKSMLSRPFFARREWRLQMIEAAKCLLPPIATTSL